MQIQIKVEDFAVRGMMTMLRLKAPEAVRVAMTRGYARIKQHALAEAKANCPISPSKAQYEATLKAGYKPKNVKRGGVLAALGLRPSTEKVWGARMGARTAQASTGIRFDKDGKVLIGSSTLKSKRNDFHPGNLTKSIQGASNEKHAEIYVPSNSLGGKYAFYIEEEGPAGAGKWQKRGFGTVRKGARAKDHFIGRAVNDNVEKFKAMLADELGKAIRSVNGGG